MSSDKRLSFDQWCNYHHCPHCKKPCESLASGNWYCNGCRVVWGDQFLRDLASSKGDDWNEEDHQEEDAHEG